jgi:hypothetical protein
MAGGQVFGVASSVGNFSTDRLTKEVRRLGQPMMRWRQFTRQESSFSSRQGDTLLFPKRLNLDADESTGAIVGERQPIPSAGYRTLQGSVVCQKSAIKIPYTMEAELYSEIDLDQQNREALADFMAKALNRRAFNAFNSTNVCYIPTGTDTVPTATWDVDGTPSTSATRDNQLFDLKEVVDALKAGTYGANASAPVQPYDAGGNYQQIASVQAARALRDDDEWEEAARFGDPERLWAAEIGRIYMTRTVEDNAILGLNNNKKGEAVIFGKDPVIEIIALREEVRMEIPAELGTDLAIGFCYLGGFKLTWDYNSTTEPDNRVVKITSS